MTTLISFLAGCVVCIPVCWIASRMSRARIQRELAKISAENYDKQVEIQFLKKRCKEYIAEIYSRDSAKFCKDNYLKTIEYPSEAICVIVANPSDACDFREIKRFTFNPNDDEDYQFAKREAEELIEVIKNF